jgi:hypothetical protein
MENATHMEGTEQTDEHFLPSDPHDDTIGAILLLVTRRRKILQIVSSNDDMVAIHEQDCKLLDAFISGPKVEEAADDLRSDYLASVKGEIRRQFGFIHVLADQQAAGIHTGMVRHRSSPQQQGLLCDHLLIVPELNSV